MKRCYVLYAALAFLILTGPVRAATTTPASPTTCNISQAAKSNQCATPVASVSGMNSARSDPGMAAGPLDPYLNVAGGKCRYVDNYSTSTSFFIPFKSPQEWQAFVTNAGANFKTNAQGQNNAALVHCARPLQPNDAIGLVTPCDAQAAATTGCTICNNPVPASYPVQPGYGRTGTSITVPETPLTFICTTGSINWAQTVQRTYLALDSDTYGPPGSSTWQPSWQVTTTIYNTTSSPPKPVNGVCSSVPMVCTSGAVGNAAGNPNAECNTTGGPTGCECNSGTPSNCHVGDPATWTCTATGTATWTCSGSNGGSTASCSAPLTSSVSCKNSE